jgi:tRNA-splicing ligase RtcB
MLWAQDYAMMNRSLMMDAVLHGLFAFVGHGRETDRINCHHNFAQREEHGGQQVWVTRKGAVQALAGQRGIIPGSMGARSYIVEGLGNPASYCSCSHGAGRRLSRHKAKQELTAASLEARMQGKAWNANAVGLLDEHPDAYKDINQVMADQQDLVKPLHTLTQILNYKGF